MGVWRIGDWLGQGACRISTSYATFSLCFVAIFGLIWSIMGVDLCRIRWRSTSRVSAGGGRGVCPFFFEGGRATSAEKIHTSWWTRGAENLLLLWARLLRGQGSCCNLVKGNEVTW